MNELELLRSLVADIEAMQCQAPRWVDEVGEPDEGEGWFGPFENGTIDYQDYSGHYVQWPNLSILLEKTKQLLEEANKTERKIEK